jgi:hypothetical protein
MLLESFSTMLAVVLAFASLTPAQAQGYDMSNNNNVKVTTSPALPNIGRAYSIRVTRGAHTNAGWEKPLTDSDPNLKHWTWVPVTSFDQAYIHVAPGSLVKDKRPEHIYVKPTHVSTVVSRPDHVYVKPVHVPLPVVNHPVAVATTENNHATTDVYGKVRAPHRDPDHSLIAETKVYSQGYGEVSGRIRPSTVTAMSESTSVYGKLMTKTKTH